MTTLREWLTARFETPFAKSTKALVIVGGKGSGKTIAANLIARELPKGRALTMTGRDTRYMDEIADIEKYYLAIVEEIDADSHSHIKHLISSNRIRVSPKAADAFTAPFNINFVLTCEAFSPGDDHRRFIVATPMEVFATLADMPRNHR